MVHPQPAATRGIRHKCSSQERHHCTFPNTVNRRGPWGASGLVPGSTVYFLVICILLIPLHSGNLQVSKGMEMLAVIEETPQHPSRNTFLLRGKQPWQASWENPGEAAIPSPCKRQNGKPFSEQSIQHGLRFKPKRDSPSLFGHVLRKPWPMYSLISGMAEAKEPELSNPINTKGWRALCKRVSF